MDDKNFDEKMKDIEREIDSAIDQLFVDKISEASQDFEAYELQQEKPLEEEVVAGAEKEEEKVSAVSDEAQKAEEGEAAFRELDTLKSRIEKFLEWGVTDKALDNVANAIQKISHDFQENKFIESVTNMISDVLNFLKENPDSHLKEMVDFLMYAFGSIPKLIKSDKEGADPDEIFNAVNAQFSSISSMMTFDIPKIELEERFTIPEEEAIPEEASEVETATATTVTEEKTDQPPQPLEEQEGEAAQEAEEESALDMAFVDLEEPIAEGEPPVEELSPETAQEEIVEEGLEEKEEETVGEVHVEEREAEGMETVEVEEIEEVEELVVPPVGAEEPLFRYKTFKDIADELTLALKKVENSFFQTNNILDISGRLSTEIESLVSITDKLISVISYGMPTDSDVKQLQKTVAEINEDYKVLAGFFEQSEGLKAEEIVPVIVGRKMVGLLSSAVKNIYAISSAQEASIKQKGHIKIKGEEIPFIDLLEIFGETSESHNKRVVIMEGPDGQKAVLVNRVMKRRFALVSGIGEQDVQKNARFYFAEEIPVYEL